MSVLISRQAAIDLFPNDALEWDTKDGYVAPHLARRMIEELPTVQPEPQEGHWIPHETPDGGELYECSRCGVLWEFNDGTPEDNEAYYCPKCGAKLKGAQNG